MERPNFVGCGWGGGLSEDLATAAFCLLSFLGPASVCPPFASGEFAAHAGRERGCLQNTNKYMDMGNGRADRAKSAPPCGFLSFSCPHPCSFPICGVCTRRPSGAGKRVKFRKKWTKWKEEDEIGRRNDTAKSRRREKIKEDWTPKRGNFTP